MITTPQAYPVGIGLKSQHYREALSENPDVAFYEVHAENHMVDGGPHRNYLLAIAEKCDLSVHGVGLSLGSAEGLDKEHLNRFKQVVDTFDPILVSEHLAWSVSDGTYLNDLLPLPMNEETFGIVSDNIQQVQDTLGRQILVENPSSYLAFAETSIPEPEFLIRLSDHTGCGLLLDVNNIYVSAKNMHWDPIPYVDSIPADKIGEIHLAGHLLRNIGGEELRIDDHGSEVCDDVWQLYERLIQRVGVKPTLIEWDTNIPEFDRLVAEAHKARDLAMKATMITQEAAHG